jgi:predicted amidohydrolase YtcJ
VLARRGGHLAVANSAALQAAGVGPDRPDPPGGKIGRLADGGRDGTLEGGAVYQVAAFAPGPGPGAAGQRAGQRIDCLLRAGAGRPRERAACS